ncbi:hypothetical protein [Amycolatopsis dongchuanensis]|uniref:Uncharacterized protein n=1 Tax=Amycolatopsis dongchuanensis TaxID=1070866 RepID=A0ABP8VGN2_9PSEU
MDGVEVVLRTARGLTISDPGRLIVEMLVDRLEVGKHLIVEPADGDTGPNVHYIQVMRQAEDDYQLEYRAGSPQEHYQTHLAAPADVVDALFGWSKGDWSWRDRFEWKWIGDWFAQS